MRRGHARARAATLRVVFLAVLALALLLGSSLATGAAFAAASAATAGRQTSASVLVPHPRVRPLARLALAAPASAAKQPAAPAAPGNFPFQTARSADGRIVVHYYDQPASFAQQIIALAQQDLAQVVQPTLGFPLRQPVNIYVYGSRDDFLAGAPVTNPAETAALTVSQTSTIYLQSSDPSDDGATDALPHELTHIVFHQNEDVGHLADAEFGFLPLWLDEGLAAYDEPAGAQGVHDYESALDNAVTSRHLVDILRDFALDYPKDPASDDLAYAESRAFIGYLIGVYGLPRFHQFLGAVRDGQFMLGAQTAFGADLPMLESRWQTSLGLPPTTSDTGLAPILSTPFPFPPGKMFPLASQTTPIGIPDPVDLLPVWQVATLLVLLLVIVVLARLSPRPRRQYEQRGVLLTLPIVAEAQPQPQPQPLPLPLASNEVVPDASATPPVAPIDAEAHAPAPVPDDIPYPMPLEMLQTLAAERAHAEAQPAAQAATRTAPSLEPAPLAKLTPRARMRRFDAVVVLLALPLAALAGFGAVRLDPRLEWHTGYLAAALAGAACGALLLLRLLMQRRWRQTTPPAHVAGVLLACLVAVFSFAQASPAAQVQARAYESRDAYALALRTYADSGEPARQLAADEARIHDEWAQSALVVEDFPIAVTQYDAAILVERPYGSAGQDRAALLAAMAKWAQGLRAQGKFDAALSAYAAQLASPACDAGCAGQMRDGSATTYLAWAGALSAAGDYSTALARLSAVTASNGGPEGYARAQAAAREVAALQTFETALQAGGRGDPSAMNAGLRSVLAQYPHTAAAQMAGEAAEPVSGTLVDATGASTAGDRLYFLAFASQGQAQSFHFDFNADGSAFKIATTVGAEGAFTTRLPAGYWYVPCWDDPAWASNGFFNASMSLDNSAFLVQPLTPKEVGQILGY